MKLLDWKAVGGGGGVEADPLHLGEGIQWRKGGTRGGGLCEYVVLCKRIPPSGCCFVWACPNSPAKNPGDVNGTRLQQAGEAGLPTGMGEAGE